MLQRKFIFFVLSVILHASALWAQQSQPMPISERIGVEIDEDERKYFNLFADIEGFKSAIYRYDAFGNLQFLISLENGNDTVLVVGNAGVPELIKYIELHESIYEPGGYEVNWSLLYGIRPKKLVSYEYKGDVFTVFTDFGNFVGELLHVTDSSIMLWQKDGYYNYPEHKDKIVHLAATDIKQMVRKQNLKSSLFGFTLSTGLAAGAVAFSFNFFQNNKQLSDYNILLMTAGAAALGVGVGRMIDLLTDKTRRINIANNVEVLRKYKKSLQKRAIFRTQYPPELRTFPLKRG